MTASRYFMCCPTIKNTVLRGMMPSVDKANLDSSVNSIHTIFGCENFPILGRTYSHLLCHCFSSASIKGIDVFVGRQSAPSGVK